MTTNYPYENEDPKKFGTVKAYKNLIVLGFGFLFLFSAFNALQNLQSSLYPEFGFISLCLIYGSFMTSCLVVPSLMIRKIGKKYTLVVAMIGFVLYTLANFYPRDYTLLTASVILGFCAAPLWTSQASYLTTVAMKYAESAGLNQDFVVSKFFCIFYVLFQMAQVIGNTVSSMILKPADEAVSNVTLSKKICGAYSCPVEASTSKEASNIEDSTVTTLMIIYVIFGVAGVAFILFLMDRIRDSKKETEVSIISSIFETAKFTSNKKLLLMIPITTFSGMEQAFAFGDLTSAYVSCEMGIENVGFIMICFGAVGGVSSLAFGAIVKWTGTLLLMILGLLMHLGLLVWCLIWETHTHPVVMFYVAASVAGLCDAIWVTQINALYGIFFADHKEPAFSHFKLWQSLGFVIAFSYGQHLCTSYKIYILIGLLGVSFIFYCIAEYVHRKSKRGLGSRVVDESELRKV